MKKLMVHKNCALQTTYTDCSYVQYLRYSMYYRIVQKFDNGTFDKFDKWLAFHQSFSYQPSSLNASPMKLTTIRQSFAR